MRQKNRINQHRQSIEKEVNTFNNARKIYVSSSNYDVKVEKLGILSNNGIITKKISDIFLAKAHLELATMSNGSLQGMHIDKVIKHAQKAEQISQFPSDRIESAYFNQTLPIAMNTYIFGEQPNLGTLERTYKKLSTIALTEFNRHSDFNGNAPRDKTESMVGILSEALALMMLQRYAVVEMGTNDFIPVPSLLSQDESPHDKKYNKYNWDISVFSPSVNDDPTYKLQIKYGSKKNDEYANDVQVIRMSALDGPERYVTLKSLVVSFDDVVNGHKPLRNHTAQVNQRTESILDLMG